MATSLPVEDSVERSKVRALSNDGAWERKREMGRLSGQAGRKA